MTICVFDIAVGIVLEVGMESTVSELLIWMDEVTAPKQKTGS